MTDRDLWIAIRMALLHIVDAIERRWGMARTSDLRRWAKQHGWNELT